MTTVAPLFVGLAFGWLLERAGLTRHDRIVRVFRFADLSVVKFLLSALVAGAIGVQAAASLGFVSAVPVTATHVAANLLGGGLFGIGMAFTGFCPGTIAAGAGTGQLDYLLAGVPGLLFGALLFGWTYRFFAPGLAAIGDAGTSTFPTSFGVSGWLVIIVLGEVAALAFYAAERFQRRPRD